MAIRSLLLDTTAAAPVDPPVSSLVYGQQEPTAAPGPNGGEATYTTAWDTQLAPTGTGVWRYVDASATGANNGTSWTDAFTTIAAAQAAAAAGDSIIIAGGTYREAITLSKSGTATDKIKMTRRGTDRVRITGAEVLTGWTACTDQADALGSPSWANCYKAFVPAGAFVANQTTDGQYIGGPYLGLAQDGVKLRLPINGDGYKTGLTDAEKLDRAYLRNNSQWFFQGGSRPASNQVSNPGLSVYSAADLTHAWAVAHFTNGNNVNQAKITAFDEGTNTVTLLVSNSSYTGKIAIFNAGIDMDTPGMWCFSETLEGDGTRKVVVYPYGGADLSADAATVEYCDRTTAISVADRAHWTFFGLDGEMVLGWSGYSGRCFGKNSHNGSPRTDFWWEECRAHNLASGNGYTAGFDMSGSELGIGMVNCTVTETEGDGLQASSFDYTDDTLLFASNNYVSRTYGTTLKVQGVSKSIVQRNLIEDNKSAHGNGGSSYLHCRDLVIAFNKVRTGQAIGWTFQRAANVWMIGNDISVYDVFARGIEQNSTYPCDPGSGTSSDPYTGNPTQGVMVVMNNTCAPPSSAAAFSSSGITWGKITANDHVVMNNATHGLDGLAKRSRADMDVDEGVLATGDEQPRFIEESYNIETYDRLQPSAWTTGQDYIAGTAAADYADNQPKFAGNALNTNLAAIWRDVDGDDLRPVISGPLDGTGQNPNTSLASGIVTLFPDTEAWGLPAVDWNTDILGNAIDWTAPPIGAYA